MSIKIIFVGTEEVHYFKKQFDIKNQFCKDKGKGIQSWATPTRKEVYVGTVIVSNSVSKEFGVKQT